MQTRSVESVIEDFVRTHFKVASTDPGFDSQVDLFERGYIDSIGFVELIEFLNVEFGVEISDEDLLSDNFSTVAGIAYIVSQMLV